jgi:hypothetical protein
MRDSIWKDLGVYLVELYHKDLLSKKNVKDQLTRYMEQNKIDNLTYIELIDEL